MYFSLRAALVRSNLSPIKSSPLRFIQATLLDPGSQDPVTLFIHLLLLSRFFSLTLALPWTVALMLQHPLLEALTLVHLSFQASVLVNPLLEA